VIWITEAEPECLQPAALGSDGRSLGRRRDKQKRERETRLSERVRSLSGDDLDAVSGEDQLAHLPQSIHMDYGKPSIDQNPTRLA